MAAVSLFNIGKRYGLLDVLKDVSLEVENGEFTVLVGPSGCGKSTLLSIVAGLETQSSGQIEIGGRWWSSPTPFTRP